MTTTLPLLRNAALSIPVAVVLGAVLWGAEVAAGAAVASGVVLANLWVLSVLGPRVVSSMARQQSPALWVGLLVLKFGVMASALLLLVRSFPPIGVSLGFVPLVLGVLATGIQLAQEEARREAADAANPPSLDPDTTEA